MNICQSIIIFFLALFCLPSLGLHVKGTWRTGSFFHFLAKFGFQQTNLKNRLDTQGYIYGNITSKSNLTHLAALTVVDRGYFLDYYGNSTVQNREQACLSMFNKINTAAYDSQCYDEGPHDFLRKVPCPVNQLCPDEDKPDNVVSGYQFTYGIQDFSQPRFYYVSLVACYRDKSSNCTWKPVNEDIEIEYDIWLVNGNPHSKSRNPFEYQFSFEKQDVVEIFLVFLISYFCLAPVQFYVVARQKHPVPKLFTAGVLLALTGVFLNVVHALMFAFDGVGFVSASIVGGIFDILSQTLLMLLLLLLAKGWAVTRLELTWKPVLFIIWGSYGIVHVLLYVWDLTEVEVIEDIDEYQTWPGWFILILRTVVMAWFLYSLKTTMAFEQQQSKLDFFLHFGAASLVWFIYLPIVALVGIQISSLWRRKFLLGITYSANFLAYAVMAHLLWPSRSQQYFLLANETDFGEELEEFDEAPHIVNRGSTTMRKAPKNSMDASEMFNITQDSMHTRVVV
nr:EOG090X03T7 [Eulimnadia texana]